MLLTMMLSLKERSLPMEENERRIIALGEEARQFTNSSLYVYISESAEHAVNVAMSMLSKADPEDAKEIRRLQNIVARYNNFDNWLNELIEAGSAAYGIYLEGEE